MKTKYSITFTVDAQYPYVEDEAVMNDQLIKWLKKWAIDEDHSPLPTLLEQSVKAYDGQQQPNGCVRVKILKDGDQILDTWWDQLSDDF
jgi:hypothetical protein